MPCPSRRISAAKAAVEIGDTLTAIREYAEVGAKYDKQERAAEVNQHLIGFLKGL